MKRALLHRGGCPEHFCQELVESGGGKAEGFLSSGRLPRASGQFVGEIEFLDLEVEFALRGGQNKAGRLTVGVNPSPAGKFFRLDRLAQLRKEAESEHAARGFSSVPRSFTSKTSGRKDSIWGSKARGMSGGDVVSGLCSARSNPAIWASAVMGSAGTAQSSLPSRQAVSFVVSPSRTRSMRNRSGACTAKRRRVPAAAASGPVPPLTRHSATMA